MLKTALTASLALMLTLPAIARAEFSAATRAEWSAHQFNGEPKLPYPQPVVHDYLQLKEPTCAKAANTIASLTQDYADAAARSAKSKAKHKLEDIRDFLLVKTGYDDQCFRDVAATYLLASMLVSDPNYEMALHGFNSPSEGMREYVPGNVAPFVLMASFLNHGTAQILTPKLRAKLGKSWERTTLGAAAKPPDWPSPYALRGAYDCGGSAIYLDAVTSPFNLSAEAFHELDHVLRDKLTPFDPAKRASWKAELLLDESLALVAGIYRELVLSSLGANHNSGLSRFVRSIRGFSYNPVYTAYAIQGDRDLFSPDGPLMQLWKSPGMVGSTLLYFDHFTFLRGCWTPQCQKDFVTAKLNELYNRVDEVYFPGTALADTTFLELLKFRSAWDASGHVRTPIKGLHNWLEEDAAWVPIRLAATDPDAEWQMHLGKDRVSLPLAQTFAAVDQVEKLMSKESDECKALSEAAKDDPEVRAYIGSEFSLDGVPGRLAGGEGGVKGDEPVRACFLLKND